MKKFYKICVYLLIGLLIFLPSFSSAWSANTKFWDDKRDGQRPTVKDPKKDGQDINDIAQGTHDTIYDESQQKEKLNGILRFPKRSEYSTTLGYAVRLVQVAINWILGILAFVALIYMLYSGFLVFSSGADDGKAKKGRKGISTAAIALAGIGLSWLIVSAMIWFITILSDPK